MHMNDQCEFAGMAVTLSAPRVYTLVASNSGGDYTTDVTITVTEFS
jgi:hypothetical protein